MAPDPKTPQTPPAPDLSPQKPDESWSDYWARSHRNANVGKTSYPWGNSEWPGTDKSDNKYIYRPELVNIAKALRQDLANYTGEGLPASGSGNKTKSVQQQLSDTFGVTEQQIGAWDVPSTFHGSTLTKTQRAVIDANNAFVSAYQAVIRRIEIAAGISQDAEDQSQAAVNNPNNLPNQTY
ncbi:hypothetical protein [Actinoallomurus iriomotensis]|uniref:Uncharacterized protein n=1 Tax=Actinoallomurus iriomotensis TaxID=478107 RepID=A0A9W6RIM6_9ACTN|nr:hypothetical protein [Actinoallomurus iriomotensis]GLY74742.1 hypothetical protein Airi01_030090 [Actinoallomurus iriomotensis]